MQRDKQIACTDCTAVCRHGAEFDILPDQFTAQHLRGL